jgi:hypothetical protein
MQIIMVLAIFIFNIRTRKLMINREKVKEVLKKCIEIINKYILIKAIVVLLVVKGLEQLILILINK